MSIFRKLSKHYPKIPGYRRLRPKHCQVYGIGSPKTGTHSLVSMFSRHFRTLHEAEVREEIGLLSRHLRGECTSGEIQRWFIERDQRLWLDCDVSHLHGYFADDIARALPEAKFILTIREPYSWLDSAFNQTLGRPPNALWEGIRRQVNGAYPETFPEQENTLQALGLYPIGHLLNRWAERIDHVTRAIPAERLLIIKTGELKQSANAIADFCGLDVHMLVAEQGHQFTAAKKAGVLDNIDKNYVDALIQQRCGEILRQYF